MIKNTLANLSLEAVDLKGIAAERTRTSKGLLPLDPECCLPYKALINQPARKTKCNK